MRRLLACTCLTPFAVAALSAVHAETVISTKVTNPVATATANNGQPDDIRIASGGSVAPTDLAAGVAACGSAGDTSTAETSPTW